jgi:hypothetical protein
MNAHAPLEQDIEYCRLADLDRRFGIRRSTAYTLISEGKIRSRIVRHKGSFMGVRLVDLGSVREFLAACPDKPSQRVSDAMAARAYAPRKPQNGAGE